MKRPVSEAELFWYGLAGLMWFALAILGAADLSNDSPMAGLEAAMMMAWLAFEIRRTSDIIGREK